MKFVDEFRTSANLSKIVADIRNRASRRWVLMEVCGGQTHNLMKYGIPAAVSDCVELIHGPGCPVCVTPEDDIDRACELAKRADTIVATFGDMIRVPGRQQSLLQARSGGANVVTVYSPIEAVRLAERTPQKHVVFFAVGFETTVPATAMAVLQAEQRGVKNFSMLVSHVRVLPAMEGILSAADCRVQAFLAAGHVCAVTGTECYERLAEQFRLPIVVTGFEPFDLLQGILQCVSSLEAGEHGVTNRYQRVVRTSGNTEALRMVSSVYQVVDRPWRGLGVIPGGGYALQPRFQSFDATVRFRDELVPGNDRCASAGSQFDCGLCRAADVLSGRLRPADCPEFASACTPETPLGAPMVSSEGACAAWYRYHRVAAESLSRVESVKERDEYK